ncbi:MAG: DUF4142 domain-containing protein [Acidobacteriota bacterium]|nr:DUF4142 domain-containing protein [Acidobacteriota bacterium]
MKRIAPIAALALFAACTADTTQHAHPKPPKTQAQSIALTSQDRDFLERAAEGSNAEVHIGALAPTRALRPEVKAFGQMMVTDHTAANRKLAQIAAAKRISLPTGLGEHQQNFDRVVDEQLDPFDREFIRVMIGDHQQAAELFRNEAMNGTDPDLKAYAAATLPAIEAHLQHAQSMAALAAAPQDGTVPPTPDATQPAPYSTPGKSPEPEAPTPPLHGSAPPAPPPPSSKQR